MAPKGTENENRSKRAKKAKKKKGLVKQLNKRTKKGENGMKREKKRGESRFSEKTHIPGGGIYSTAVSTGDTFSLRRGVDQAIQITTEDKNEHKIVTA